MHIPQKFIDDLDSQRNEILKDLDKWRISALKDYIYGEGDLTDEYIEELENSLVWKKMRDMQRDMLQELSEKIYNLFNDKPLDERYTLNA